MENKVPAEIQLDILTAVNKRKMPDMVQCLECYEAKRPKNDHLAAYRETLQGGDAEAGRQVFLNKTDVACLRCHKINGQGGEVGTELTGIGGKQTREYLLESIVDPNRQIAKGFETVVLALKNGQAVSGIIKEETEKQVKLITPEAKFVTVPKDQIEA